MNLVVRDSESLASTSSSSGGNNLPSPVTEVEFAQPAQTTQLELPGYTQTRSTNYIEKRRKNNQASKISRMRKKEQFQYMKKRIAELEEENDLLKQQIATVLALSGVAGPKFKWKQTWRARGARAYTGGLGAEPPAGSRGLSLIHI